MRDNGKQGWQGPKGQHEARRTEARVEFLGRGSEPPPHQLRGLKSAVSSPSEIQGGAPAA